MADFTTFKRGMSWSGTLVWTPGPGEPANLIGWTVTSSVRDGAYALHELNVTNPSGDGINFVTSRLDTTAMASGTAAWDVRYSHASGATYTDTWYFEVEPNVTPGSFA